MSTLKYQNPVTVDSVLDSANLGGSPELRREIIVVGDSAGNNAAVVGTALKTDGSAVTQPVSIAAALPAGAALLGKVGIDQTTPGTTNGVQVNAALPAGANVIGHVINDTGSTTAVTGNVTAVQPTASNLHVAATLDAETTKVIGTTRTLGNLGAVMDSVGTAATAPANALLTSVKFNSTAPALTTGQAVACQSDSVGAQYVNVQGRVSTYRAGAPAFVPKPDAAKPTWSIQGSASKTVRITRIKVTSSTITGTATPFANGIILQKFSVLTGGVTGTTPTPALNDSLNAAATAVVLTYSTVPSTATAIGGPSATELMQTITSSATANGISTVEFSFGACGTQPLVLRGVAEYFGLTVTAVGALTPIMSVWVEWQEE